MIQAKKSECSRCEIDGGEIGGMVLQEVWMADNKKVQI